MDIPEAEVTLCVIFEQPPNSTLFSPCSYFFIIVNYWAAVKYLSLCNTFATDSSHEIPSVSFCEALFANSPFFLQNDKAELLIWTNCFRPVSRQSHGQILGAGKNTSNLSPQSCIILLNLSSLKIMAFCFLRDLVTI